MASEYTVEVKNGMVSILLYPEGTSVAVYSAAVLKDKTAIKQWNNLVSSFKSLSKDLTKTVHYTYNRDDLTSVIYYCDDLNSSHNPFLVVMGGVVYYDRVNGIDLLGLG